MATVLRRPATVQSDLLNQLDEQINDILAIARAQEYWTAITSPATPMNVTSSLLRRVFLETACFTPRVVEAGIAIVGQLPKTDPKLLQRLLIHLADEADHGEIAFNNYVALGGDKHYFDKHPLTPSSFSVLSWWWGMFHSVNPFAYLGAMYVFEAITPAATADIVSGLKERGYTEEQVGFMTMHATEDIKHQNLLRAIIVEVAEKYPNARSAIEYGIRSFTYVYPLPVWACIWHDVQRELGKQ